MSATGTLKCVLRAELPGYESNVIDLDDRSLGASPTLPALPVAAAGPAEAAEHVFRSDVRLVDLYATVFDSRGR